MASIVEKLQRRVDIYALKLEAVTKTLGGATDTDDTYNAELALIDAQLLLDRELEAIADKARKVISPPVVEEISETQRMTDQLERKFRIRSAANQALENTTPHYNEKTVPKQGGHATYADPTVIEQTNAPLVFTHEDELSTKCDKDDRCRMLEGHTGACGWQEMGHDNKPITIRANPVARCHTQACVKRRGHLDDCTSSTGQVLGVPVADRGLNEDVDIGPTIKRDDLCQ